MKKRKILSILLCLVLLFSLAPFSGAAGEGRVITANPINILVGGEKFLPTDSTGKNVPVFEYNGTTYAPLRALAESYGLSVGYNNTEKLATVTGSTSFKNFVPSKGTAQAMTKTTGITVYPINIMVNDEVFKPVNSNGTPVEVFTYNGTTYAPLRALAEAYGLLVGYDHTQRLASVDFDYENEVLSSADALREAIVSCETTIVKSDTFIPGKTYTGTAYYVSSSTGKDSNNGLSPNSPIQNIAHVNNLDLKPGDAVFFMRGDTWRVVDNLLNSRKGVTYSAYGEGGKPLITGSPENGAVSSKWELYYEGADGEKVWKFYRDITDVGGLVVNGGEAVLHRSYGWWNGSGYTAVEPSLTATAFGYDWILKTHGVQTPESSLDDLEFCCMIDYSGCNYPIRRHELYYKGGLFLRCDEGNPGEVFNSIEFMTQELNGPSAWMALVRSDSDTVFDNLNISFWSNCAISPCGDPEVSNVLIQNCEVAYGGNGIHEFISAEPTTEYMLSGDGIYGLARNGKVYNNYVHDVDGGAITFEAGPNNGPVNVDHFIAENNLVERCGAGIQLNDGNNNWNFDKISIVDNIVVDTGGGWTHNCFCPAAAIAIGSWGKVSSSIIEIKNNVMLGSTMSLLFLNEAENVRLSSNSYICTDNDIFATMNWESISDLYTAKSRLAEIGENGTFVRLP